MHECMFIVYNYCEVGLFMRKCKLNLHDPYTTILCNKSLKMSSVSILIAYYKKRDFVIKYRFNH